MDKLNNSTPVENSLEARDNPNNNTGRLRAAAVVRPPVNQEALANVVKELEYLTSLGLTRNSDNEAMKTALRRYKELTGRDYEFPTTTPELSKVIQKLEYLTSLGLTASSDNEAMKTALIEYHSLTGYEYVFPQEVVLPVITMNAQQDGHIGDILYSNDSLLLLTERKILRLNLRTGVISTVAGNGVSGYSGDGGPATQASLFNASAMTLDSNRNLFFVSLMNPSTRCIRRIDAVSNIITTVSDASNNPLVFNAIFGITTDREDNLIVSDSVAHKVFRISAQDHSVSTVAGTGSRELKEDGGLGDGGPARLANLSDPVGVAVDGAGNVFFSDAGYSLIRKVDNASGIITTVAGTFIGGRGPSLVQSLGDGLPATSADLNRPTFIAVDSVGNIFISDQNNHRIRRVDAGTQIMTTFAGSGIVSAGRFRGKPAFKGASGDSGDGDLATKCKLEGPTSLCVDNRGNLYVLANSGRVRKIDVRTGIIRTIIGPPAAGGRRRKMKQSRRVKKSRRVRKSRRINR